MIRVKRWWKKCEKGWFQISITISIIQAISNTSTPFLFFFPLNFTQNSGEIAKLIQHNVRIDQANPIPMLSKPVTKVFVQVKNWSSKPYTNAFKASDQGFCPSKKLMLKMFMKWFYVAPPKHEQSSYS